MMFFKSRLWLIMLPALLIPLLLTGAAGAGEDFSGEPPLSQADLDGYVYLLPRLLGRAAQDPETAAALLAEAGLSRRRAAYVGAKVAVTQAMVAGALDPGSLAQKEIPAHLHPSAEELSLVQKNLTSLIQAQQTARRAAAGL